MPQSATKKIKGEGNTKTSPKSRNWTFTLNNYKDEEYNEIIATCHSKNWNYIFGKEIGESGTPHIQGFINYDNTIRFDTLKKIMNRAHIEKSRGNIDSNIVYCSKDGEYETNWTEDEIEEARARHKLREPIKKIKCKDSEKMTVARLLAIAKYWPHILEIADLDEMDRFGGVDLFGLVPRDNASL